MNKILLKTFVIALIVFTTIATLYFKVLAQNISPFDLVNLKLQGLGDITAYEKIKITDAWNKINDLRPPLSSVVVGIFDTGIDIFHPEFSHVNIDTSITTDTKERGHGTQIIGIIGANNLSFSGQYIMPQMNGILSGIRNLDYALRVRFSADLANFTLKDNFRQFWELDKMAQLAGGLQVVNTSFGAPLGNQLTLAQRAAYKLEGKGHYNQNNFDAVKDIFTDLLSQYPNTLFVFASGNDGIDAKFNLPGGGVSANNLVTVGATNLDDERATPFPLTLGLEESNFGSSVNISAPGVNVYAPKPNNQYDSNFSGTSASAPMVTGVAGLIKAIKPELTPAQVKDILVRNADPIQTDKPIGGRLNALKAVCDPLILNCAPTPPPQLSNTWQSVGPMTTERAEHTATLLNDGRVLVIGGFKGVGTGFTVLDSAEIFNPQTNTFTAVGNMTSPRAFHTATLLQDGKVLIAGGVGVDGNTALNTVEIFDPAANTFTPISNMNQSRFFHTSNLLSNGRVLIAGGIDFLSLKSTEIFNPQAGTFTFGPEMNMPRVHHASTRLNDGRILLVNGLVIGSIMSVDIYNPASNIFASATSSAEQLGLSVTTLSNGKVLIFGSKLFNQPNGQAAEVFDPLDNSFAEIGPMPIFGIARDSLVLLNSGQVLFVGANIKAQIFNPQTNEFKLTGDLNTPRLARHRLVSLQDGRALVAGGQLSGTQFITTNGAEVFKP